MNQAVIHDLVQVSREADKFCGWPTITRLSNGELVVVCSGNRSFHVCPFGRVLLFRSQDNGKSWSPSSIVADGPLDDRDAGVLQTAQGHLLVTWFTSLTYEWADTFTKLKAESLLSTDDEAAWKERQSTLTDDVRHAELGCWATISTDGGQSWSEKIDTLVNSPHGPTLLDDGRLFYAGKFRTENREPGHKGGPFQGKIGAAHSLDGGRSWQKLSEIAPMPGHDAVGYHELHAVQAADGRIVAQIRNHCEPHPHEVLQTESFDGGRSWTPVRSTGLWGFPTHLLKLSDGRLMMSYSHRREPVGNYVCLSEDHGANWSPPLRINQMRELIDFGYPSSVELGPNRFLTLWYERLSSHQLHAVLRVADWEVPS
jgi:hypothetical protein